MQDTCFALDGRSVATVLVYATLMRIIQNTPDRFVVRDRSIVPTLAVLTIALAFAGLGTGAALFGEDSVTRLGGLGFAVLSMPMAGFGLFIAQEHTHIFDRGQGVLMRRVWRLIGGGEVRTIPLDRVHGVEVAVTREIADPDTFGIELLISPERGGDLQRLPLRNYQSSIDPSPIFEPLQRWLVAGR